eukprot:scaffold832_cov403-Prasinococcus_capsulatus_cf.AAC.6
MSYRRLVRCAVRCCRLPHIWFIRCTARNSLVAVSAFCSSCLLQHGSTPCLCSSGPLVRCGVRGWTVKSDSEGARAKADVTKAPLALFTGLEA